MVIFYQLGITELFKTWLKLVVKLNICKQRKKLDKRQDYLYKSI